jgi:hypothetical protein
VSVKLPVVQETGSAPAVCRLLRCKTAFGAVVNGGGWRRGDSTTEVYWCLSTMEAFGPDDDLVHAHECVKGRRCWQEPDAIADDTE